MHRMDCSVMLPGTAGNRHSCIIIVTGQVISGGRHQGWFQSLVPMPLTLRDGNRTELEPTFWEEPN